eukprot:TRINITY_DN9218_c0_g1_i1.p1 TRINITY_DN9218_c0_g1~~TRINITY_DN9218_c0_g1_i1.p1  ORF type:complete len:222 (+),score=36.11 TRINITY_DN9218_c0_g1_i1:16-681(+)
MSEQTFTTEINSLLLQEKDVPEVVTMLARAFEDDPSYVYLFPIPETRIDNLNWIYQRIVTLARLDKTSILQITRDESSNQVTSVAFWEPHVQPIAFLTLFQIGILSYPFSHGISGTYRLLSLIDLIEKWQKTAPDHYYLDQLAVNPDFQGKGIGSKVLEKTLREIVDSKGVPSMLVTAKEKNVRYYQKFKFELVDSYKFDENFTMRFMKRPAQPLIPINQE